MWAQYARMRDALNKTGRQVWFSITARVEYNDSEWHVRAPAMLRNRPLLSPRDTFLSTQFHSTY